MAFDQPIVARFAPDCRHTTLRRTRFVGKSQQGWICTDEEHPECCFILVEDHEMLSRADELDKAADSIQALHPGEVKNSVILLREQADALRSKL